MVFSHWVTLYSVKIICGTWLLAYMYIRYTHTSQFYIIQLEPHPPYLHLLCSRTYKIMLSVDSTQDDELDSSRPVKLFLPLLLGHMSTGRSKVNKHIKQLCTYKNTFSSMIYYTYVITG